MWNEILPAELSWEASIVIVSASDENYFPLLKGLYLSLLDPAILPKNVKISFLDLGLKQSSLDWLLSKGVTIAKIDANIMGDLSSTRYGYRRGQTCRAFLPKIFPDASNIVWMDCDTWVQDLDGFLSIIAESIVNKDRIFISQEVHTGYLWPKFDIRDRISELLEYYGPIFDADMADKLSNSMVFNSGIFVMNSENIIWEEWKREIIRIYVEEYDRHNEKTLHFAEQMSLNMLIRKYDAASSFDPLYNYLCNWNPPFRSEDGVVRTTSAPHLPVGVIHLGGGWKRRGSIYMEKGLLYKSGSYLDDADLAHLSSAMLPR